MQARTLPEVMARHAAQPAEDKALHCWDGSRRSYFPVSYGDLSKRAFAFGAELLESPGDIAGRVVMIACHTPYATLVAFYGAISVGAIPMIFPMPLSLGSHEALTERIKHWGFAFEQPALLVLEAGLTEKFHDEIPPQITVLRISDNPAGEWQTLDASANQHSPAPEDVAFFQTTSSSTGDHKAVAISHQNIIANVVGIRHAQHMDDNERMATWLPLFHDMGLVGTVLFSFGNNYPLLIMTPTQFVKRPSIWLKGMSDYRCTIATAPNFGFDYCSRLVSDKDAAEMDLSGVKHLFIGAEPIRVSTINSFCNKFAVCGITPQTIRPAYGLAESTIITTMTDPDKVSQFVCLDADSIGINEPVKILDSMTFDDSKMVDYDASKMIAVCTAGRAIEDMLVEIVDEEGNAIREQGVAGEIAITGTSVALGYVSGSAELIDRFPQGRLRTGDMGAFIDDELYILERIKNLVIRHGENFLVSALEEQLADLLDVSHEHVAVFESNIHDPSSDIIVLVERHAPIDDAAVNNLLVEMPKEAFPINKILLSRSREIPRTTSGKKRHFYCRKMYQHNEIKFQQEIEVSPQRIMQAMNAVRTDA
ncbi:MAG: AMP-binding protein [Arenicella sp.]|nr:AMP-binding protein [Arenicella sp.]